MCRTDNETTLMQTKPGVNDTNENTAVIEVLKVYIVMFF